MAPPQPTSGLVNWLSSWSAQFLGLSTLFGTVFSSSSNILDNKFQWLALGSLIEAGRRLSQWFIERFRILQFSITARFNEGDPAYEWIVLFLTKHKVYKRSNEFTVSATNSQRKWGVHPGTDSDDLSIKGSAEYVPTYQIPQLFRWNGYWIEIQRNGAFNSGQAGNGISITIYTLNVSVLSDLVEEARRTYLEVTQPNVTIHMADQPNFVPGYVWTNVKHKAKRPLSSIILPEGIVESIIHDAEDFISSEDWYKQAGVPHRRGYLLYGPPGTGKTSTVYALAGELGMEIYSLSLSSHFVDDSYLARAISSIPKHSILLIEDIDCAFPSREEIEFLEEQANAMPGMPMQPAPYVKRSAVTLSGLLNVIDGVGSEEGRLFFATTNYYDRIDPALLRPGRIDRKIEYSHATQAQAGALFERFFPVERFVGLLTQDPQPTEQRPMEEKIDISALSALFSAEIPEGEFTTAELQGFLLGCKKHPSHAIEKVAGWVKAELSERQRKKEKEEERREKAQASKLKRQGMWREMYGRSSFFGGPTPLDMIPPPLLPAPALPQTPVSQDGEKPDQLPDTGAQPGEKAVEDVQAGGIQEQVAN